MARLRELSHTADVGFEATAATPEELFGVAARGLVRALGLEPAGAEEPGSREGRDGAGRGRSPAADDFDGGEASPGTGGGEEDWVTISRPDGERLLVEWLRELLAGAMAGRGVPAASVEEVRMPADGPVSLRARVRWDPAAGEGPVREIKGVTYHGLVVERTDDRWHARVVLDV